MDKGLRVSCTPEAPCHGADIRAEKHTLYFLLFLLHPLYFLLFPLHVLGDYMGEFYNCQVNDALLNEVLHVLQVQLAFNLATQELSSGCYLQTFPSAAHSPLYKSHAVLLQIQSPNY